MALKEFKLDDRTFQQIVDEMRKRIPFYCPEWTDHNVSDPGITLIELFAWMMEMLLFRMNQVPDLHYVRFLEMLGLRFEPPRSATGQVTFWLSEPLQSGMRAIGTDIEVATTQTETEAPQIFRVQRPFTMHTPQLAMLFVQDRGGRTHARFDLTREEERDRLRESGIDVFCTVQEGDALYLGFATATDVSDYVLRVTLQVEDLRAAGGGRSAPPYEWQAYTGGYDNNGWEPCPVKDGDDRTENMNHTNYTQFPLPKMKAATLEGVERFWVRVQLKKHHYRLSPRVFLVIPTVIGCSVAVRHEQKIENEDLGQCDGSPDQRFFLQQTPILAREPGEHLLVREPGEHLLVDKIPWHEVTDFADSADAKAGGEPKQHYMLDSITGELRFGPAIRQRDGTIKQYGQTPRRDAKLVFSCYRYGGGRSGNLEPGEINTLKTSISFIKRVENLHKISGGSDQEPLDELKMRATRLLRGSQRAVTADDFEYLACNEYNRYRDKTVVARAKCLPADTANPAQLGRVDLLIVPYSTPDPLLLGRLTDEKLQRDFEKLLNNQAQSTSAENPAPLSSLHTFLRDRCLLTTRVELFAADYQWVSIHLNVQAPPEGQRAAWEQRLLTKLYYFLNPITGGINQDGWPFGKALRVQDIYEQVRTGDTTEIAKRIREVTIFTAKPDGTSSGIAQETITLGPRSVIASGQHIIRFL